MGLIQGSAPAVLTAELEPVIEIGQTHRVGDAEPRHVVCVESCRDRTKKSGVEPSSGRTNEGVEFGVAHKIYAKYIDCMRVRNSRLAGACSGGPVPETFQRPNGKSTAAPAVEQFTLRIPAFARWRKSSINCVKLEKTAAASLCFIPLQSAIACSLAVVVLPPIAAKISPELRKITERCCR